MTLKINMQIGHFLLSLDISKTVSTGAFSKIVDQGSLMYLAVKMQDTSYQR